MPQLTVSEALERIRKAADERAHFAIIAIAMEQPAPKFRRILYTVLWISLGLLIVLFAWVAPVRNPMTSMLLIALGLTVLGSGVWHYTVERRTPDKEGEEAAIYGEALRALERIAHLPPIRALDKAEKRFVAKMIRSMGYDASTLKPLLEHRGPATPEPHPDL